MLVTGIRRDLYASTVNFNDARLYCHFLYLKPELCGNGNGVWMYGRSKKEVLSEEHRRGSRRAVLATKDVGSYTMGVVAGLQYMLFLESMVDLPFVNHRRVDLRQKKPTL